MKQVEIILVSANFVILAQVIVHIKNWLITSDCWSIRYAKW